MRMIARLFPVLTLSAACALSANASEQFDLQCAIQETTSSKPGVVTSFSRHLSLDLKSREWCVWDVGNCMTLHRVIDVTDKEIVLTDFDTDLMRLHLSILRDTWTWVDHADTKEFAKLSGETSGKCVVKDFTAFPASAQIEPLLPRPKVSQ